MGKKPRTDTRAHSKNVSVRPVRQTGTMGWSPTWLDLMPSIPSSNFQVSLSSFYPFKCTFWARTDKRMDRHTHTSQNLYILALRALNSIIKQAWSAAITTSYRSPSDTSLPEAVQPASATGHIVDQPPSCNDRHTTIHTVTSFLLRCHLTHDQFHWKFTSNHSMIGTADKQKMSPVFYVYICIL